MTLPKIVELVTKKEIPALQRYLIFEVRGREQKREIRTYLVTGNRMPALKMVCTGNHPRDKAVYLVPRNVYFF